MENFIQTLRRTAVQHLSNNELEKARITVAAIIGIAGTDRAEEQFARTSLVSLFDADTDKIKMILRAGYDRALRAETRRKNESNNKPRFGTMRPNW